MNLRRSSAGLLLLACLSVACDEPERTAGDAPVTRSERAESARPAEGGVQDAATEAWGDLSLQEAIVLELDESLAELAFSVRNLELPDRRTRRQFVPVGLTVQDLAPVAPVAETSLPGIAAVLSELPAGPVQPDQIPIGLSLWRPLFDRVEIFEHAKLQIRTARVVEATEPIEFEAELVFAGRARLSSGALVAVSASPHVRWRLVRGADPRDRANWTLLDWRTGPMQVMETGDPLFREVLAQALPDGEALARARTSLHEREVARDVLARLGQGSFERSEFFQHTAVSQHPGLAVVDLDADGFDDFYVTTRLGRSQFFRNRGDGTFEEIAEQLGIDVPGPANAALFADFDNDGDPDLVVGRPIDRSLFFENEGGHFVDRTDRWIPEGGPALVSSLSAVDFDGDGWLDLYAATYAVQLSLEQIQERLFAEDFGAFTALVEETPNPFLDVPGPPNLLFRNTGARLERVSGYGAQATLRNTYQATWSDYDSDGDQDLYLANDFAPDNMIRNDGEAGFTDVTKDMGIVLEGFGMGATWGDYDLDGREDLYVANMYSKAGNRVTNALSYLDPGYRQAAQGNYLYRNADAGFELTSGSGPSQMHVYQAGWAWGTHFFDADNDGYVDLYALAGFHTAPREVEKVGDT